MKVLEELKGLEALVDKSKIDLTSSSKPYISMSSLKRNKNKWLGLPDITGSQKAFDFGQELHRMVLEPKSPKEIELSNDDKRLANEIATVCRKNFKEFLKGSSKEIELTNGIFGGRIDIKKRKKFLADLKTTSATTENAFVKSLDKYDNFSQAALYSYLSGVEDFYFLGVSKKFPYKTFIVNCKDHPELLIEGVDKLKFMVKLLNYETI